MYFHHKEEAIIVGIPSAEDERDLVVTLKLVYNQRNLRARRLKKSTR